MKLTTGEPARDFQYCVEALRTLVEDQGHEVFASNQVVGEAYIAIQHHYGVADAAARSALVDVLTSGLVSPLKGQPIIEALQTQDKPGLFDRLIADDYAGFGLETLTLDRSMATLPRVQKL